MRVKKYQKRLIFLLSLGLLILLVVSACNLPSQKQMPPSPTMQLEIPVLMADAAQESGDAAADEAAEEVVELAPEQVEEASEEEAKPAVTETPKPQAMTEPETAADAGEGAESAVVYAATPTVISAMSDENPDPMVYIYGVTNCYSSPDMTSKVLGKTQAGTALEAYQRSWNFYEIAHPTTGGIRCWVTGDMIRPNTEAFALPGPTPIPVIVTPAATEEPAGDSEPEEQAAAVPTPTVIPYVYTENPDPMVIFYGQTYCYKSPDVDSGVSGIAYGGMALGAFRRDWNWYQVVHPTTGGLVCWVTGDTIRPNQSAFNLSK